MVLEVNKQNKRMNKIITPQVLNLISNPKAIISPKYKHY